MNLKELKQLITISERNIKMGSIPSISLPPVVPCNVKAPCTDGACYAMKAFRLYPSVRQAYNKNLETFKRPRVVYFSAIQQWLQIKKPSIFRFHVSGDIPNKVYLLDMISLALRNPDIKFLCFTKKYNLLKNLTVPGNLSIIASAWTGFHMPDHSFPIAWLKDGIENRIPKDAIECFGNCENCGMCWNLKELKRDVYFNNIKRLTMSKAITITVFILSLPAIYLLAVVIMSY